MLLLDVGHTFGRWIKKKMHAKEQKYTLKPKPFVDEIPFDLGFRQAQALVMFAMGLFFSGVSPLQSVFTFAFFLIYYWVEKYNLTFVYNKQYDGVGILWKPMLPLMTLILYIFQFLLIGYFTLRQKEFFFGGFVFVSAQTVILLLLRRFERKKKRLDIYEIAMLEQGVNPL